MIRQTEECLGRGGVLKFAPSALQTCKYRSSSYFVIQNDDHTDRHDCHVDHDE
jgi:hypothetical protein